MRIALLRSPGSVLAQLLPGQVVLLLVFVVGGFASLHQDGAQFVMADGAVIFYTEMIDPQLYRNLGNRADGAMMGEAPGSP